MRAVAPRVSDLVARLPKPRTVRAKVVCLLLVPVVSLMTLWGLTAVQTAQTVYVLTQLKQLDTAVGVPNDQLIGGLQRERIGAARYLGGSTPGTSDALNGTLNRALNGALNGATGAALAADYAATDKAVGALRAGAGASVAAATALGTQVSGPIRVLLSDLAGLATLRGEVARRQVAWVSAQAGYTKAIEDALTLQAGMGSALPAGGQDARTAAQSWAVTQLARSREMLARQVAIVARAQATRPEIAQQQIVQQQITQLQITQPQITQPQITQSHQALGAPNGAALGASDYAQFAGACYSQHELEDEALGQLGDAEAAAYRNVLASEQYQRLLAAQQTLLDDATGQGTNDAALGQAESTWSALAPGVLDRLGEVLAGAGPAAIEQVNPYSRALESEVGAGVLLGLLALGLSLLVCVWVGRALVAELVGLRDAALDLARRRLPSAIARVRAGREVDLEAEVAGSAAQHDDAEGFARNGVRQTAVVPADPQRCASGRAAVHTSRARSFTLRGTEPSAAKRALDARADQSHEIGQVAAALASVHRAALRAAIDRAEAVDGIAGVFLNLARRSQVLLHRQLALLDRMERRIEDPADLEDLFRLDHLAARMRRHAEGLIILSGAAPGRGWRRPVPLMDVVRAAVAEIEDYARVDVRQMPDVAVAGAVVADLTHLLAELVENAACFSPPHTRVQVEGAKAAAGYTLEVEDRGLGMSAQALAEANRRIGSDRPDDLLEGDRLGLFVISRLARRHGIAVALRPSPSGGTTATVLLPKALLGQPASPRATGPAAINTRRADAGGSQGVSRGEPWTSMPPPARATAPTRLSARTPPVHTSSMTAGSGPQQAPQMRAAGTGTGPADPASRSPAPRGSMSPETSAGLPRRVKQAALSPGLHTAAHDTAAHDTAPHDTAPMPDGRADPTPRTPEQARATMAAYQQGWSRGHRATPPPSAPPLTES